jgi:hypothetical protein
MSQPPKGTILAPRARCDASRGENRRVTRRFYAALSMPYLTARFCQSLRYRIITFTPG